MPIRRHGAGWEVRIQHGGRRYSQTVATRSDAQYLEAKLRQRVNDSRAGRVPSYSLEEGLERWVREEFPRLKNKKNNRYLVGQLLGFCAGKGLSEVVGVADDIRKMGLAASRTPATVNRQLALLKRIAKLAYKRWGWLENDLGAKISLVPGEVKRNEWATPAQAKKLIAASKGKVREAIRWAVLTGLRRGELLSLTPLHIRGRMIYLKDTKSGLPRAVPIPQELDPAKFPFGLGAYGLHQGFQAARKAAGVPHIRFHDLRRSYASWLIQNGVDIGVIRDLLGHSTTSMTSRYIGTNVELLSKAVARLPSISKKKRAA